MNMADKSKTEKKARKARPFEKLMVVLLNGEAISKEDIAEQLGWTEPRGSKKKGPKIYNISSYIWDIKNIPQVEGRLMVVRSIRDGKKVTAYQLISVEDAKTYLRSRGLLKQAEKAPATVAEPAVAAAKKEKSKPKKVLSPSTTPIIKALVPPMPITSGKGKSKK
jgi:hypothetical protein